MYCPTCDETLPQGMTICPNCTGTLVRHKGMVPAEAVEGADYDYDDYDPYEDRRRAKKLFGYGIGGIFLGIFVMFAIPGEDASEILGGFTLLAGYISVVVAACYYAKSKGQPAPAGLLVIFGLLGLIVLLVLPDKTKYRSE